MKIYKTGFHVKVFVCLNFYVKSYFVAIPKQQTIKHKLIIMWLKITLIQKHKGDKRFYMPEMCIYCASRETAYLFSLFNQHTGFGEQLVSMIFGIFYFIFSMFKKNEVACTGYVCEKCNTIYEADKRAQKWFWVKWLFFSIIIVTIAVPLAGFLMLHLEVEVMIALFGGLPITVLIVIWLLYKRKMIKLRKSVNPDYRSEALIKGLRVFPTGFALSMKKSRYKLVAQVRHPVYIRRFMEMNRNACEIRYNERKLHEIEKLDE